MSRRDDLIALRDAVQVDIDTVHHHKKAFPSENAYRHCTWNDSHDASMHGSVDAALAFLDAALPDFHPGMSRNIHTEYWYAWVQTKEKHFDSYEETPARALLIATLNALIAEEVERKKI